MSFVLPVSFVNIRGTKHPAALTPTLARAGNGTGEGALAFHHFGEGRMNASW